MKDIEIDIINGLANEIRREIDEEILSMFLGEEWKYRKEFLKICERE